MKKYLENAMLERLLTGDPSKELTAEKVVGKLKEGFEISGVVIKHPKTHGRCIIESSAGRWLSKDEMWWLMHDSDSPLHKQASKNVDIPRPVRAR